MKKKIIVCAALLKHAIRRWDLIFTGLRESVTSHKNNVKSIADRTLLNCRCENGDRLYMYSHFILPRSISTIKHMCRNKIIEERHVIIIICYSCILTWIFLLYRWILECLSQLHYINLNLLHGTLESVNFKGQHLKDWFLMCQKCN